MIHQILKSSYNSQSPIFIKNCLNINLLWEDVFNLLDTITEKNLNFEIHNHLLSLTILHGFFDNKIHDGAKFLSLYEIQPNKIYSAHVYANLSKYAKTFGKHKDNVDVFYLQAIGKTKWEIEGHGEYLLDVGDLIYCPKNIYHTVTSLSPRVGISYGIKDEELTNQST